MITRAQQRLLEWLQSHADDGGAAPTLDEICEGLGLKSRGSLHKHITALVDTGLLEPMSGLRRGVRLRVDEQAVSGSASAGLRTLPLVGRVAAGRPVEAISDPQSVQVPHRLVGRGECYVLEVLGDSMMDDGILDGDWVVIEHRNHASNGEVVVALIEGEWATLKRIEQRSDVCILWPANRNFAPQHYRPEQVAIQGVVVGSMRAYGLPTTRAAG